MAGKAIAKGLAALLKSDVPAPTGNKLITRTTEPSAIRKIYDCLLYTSPSPRDGLLSRMPSSA